MSIDYSAYPVLYVDDEAPNLVAVRYALEDCFTVLTATSGEEALEILEREDVAVLLSDQRMPGMSGVELCERARDVRPDAVRVIITAYADVYAAIEAINRGQVARYIAKPFRNEELAQVLRTAIDLVHIQRTVRDMEVRLLRAGQSSTAQALNAELAHELDNFVSSLSLNVQQVADLVEITRRSVSGDDARAQELLGAIQECQMDAGAALEQIRGMIQRLRSGPTAPAATARSDAARVVDSTVRILRSEIRRVAQLRVVLDGAPTVPMDATALGQVVVNLLLNASQAVTDRGAEGEIVVRVGIEKGRAVIRVSDTGPGIPEDAGERIFDPYFTTKEGGTGLGLAIVRDLLERAGGAIRAENQPSGGAVFVVDLPTVGA